MMTSLPPNKYRELVNELRDVAEVYKGTQQLRANIEKVVARYITPAAEDKTRVPRSQLEAYKNGTH